MRCTHGQDGPCTRCALAAPLRAGCPQCAELRRQLEEERRRYAVADSNVRGLAGAVALATDTERARCRAIVMRLFGNDWRGNEALEEIGDGAKT